MTKFILYVMIVQPGLLVSMHTSFWSLASCNEARTEALESHDNITFAVCIPEEQGLSTWYGADAARNEHRLRAEKDMEEVEVDGDTDIR